ncbi:unnamed protein product [Notodromas monacha]|uniref:Kelch-like protein diablo n=1 Tax=Notodromas monacha TaxID=399045 RepID=A0A7R9BRE4_9CRUS|nr:unnamed protein product [Notodromas monacha]CAG0918919.1 unnamed protein product [Notodromas monacha]
MTERRFLRFTRALLSVRSPYFKSLFTKNSHGDYDEVEILDTPGDLVSLLIEYIYSNSCRLTKDNIDRVLAASERFQIPGLREYCAQYLNFGLKPENALGLLRYARSRNLPDLASLAHRYVTTHFHEIVLRSDEFYRMDARRLAEYLRDDFLNARSEELVFETVIKWVAVDSEKRIEFLPQLLRSVRFGLVSYKFLTEQVLPHPFIANNEKTQIALYEPSVFLAEAESKPAFEIDINDPLARPRIPNQILFALGGWSAGAPTNFIETYDARSDRWFLHVSEDAPPSSYHGLVVLDNKIYMVGGFDGNTHFSNTRVYDPTTQTWEEKACMYYPRCYVSVCELAGKIYALGGYDGRTRMRSAERYSPGDNQWELLEPMQRQRSDASACSARGKVFICGGFNGQEVLNSVEAYDPDARTWTYFRPMLSPRSGVSFVCYRGSLYALGGFNGFGRMNSSECYDFDTGHWQEIPPMHTARSNFAATVMEDLVYVVGGFNGTTTISNVECYDKTTDRWYDVGWMNINRSALAACVLTDPPNKREYSYLSKAQVPDLPDPSSSNNNTNTTK